MRLTRAVCWKEVSSKLFRWEPSGVVIAFLGCLLWIPSLVAQAQQQAAQDDWALRPPTSTGPSVGQKIPSFRGSDQNGRVQDFNSIRGPKGAAIYFMRSADW